jgi:hypothetical protein
VDNVLFFCYWGYNWGEFKFGGEQLFKSKEKIGFKNVNHFLFYFQHCFWVLFCRSDCFFCEEK